MAVLLPLNGVMYVCVKIKICIITYCHLLLLLAIILLTYVMFPVYYLLLLFSMKILCGL